MKSTIEKKEFDQIYELEKKIRNMQPLTKEQIDYVKTLPKEKIIELLEIYNLCMESLIVVFMKDK